MTSLTRGVTRAHAVDELLQDLSNLLVACHSIPQDEQEAAWAADAEKITGQVALALATARARLTPTATTTTPPLGTATDAATDREPSDGRPVRPA